MRRDLQSKFKSKFQPLLKMAGKFKNYLIFTHTFNLSLCLCALIFQACSNNKIIEQDKLVHIYTDLLIAQDTLALNEKSADSLRQSVFQKYNVNETDYENTINYYNEDLQRWEEFFDKVTAHLGNLKTKPD